MSARAVVLCVALASCSDAPAIAGASTSTSTSALPPSARPPTPSVGAVPAKLEPARIALVGDIALAFHIAAYLKGAPAKPPLEPGYPFAFVAERLRSYDYLVGNLECVVTETASARARLSLDAPLSTPGLLRDAGFDALSVANNHAFDFGVEGFQETLRRLDAEGLKYFGSTFTKNDAPRFHVAEVKGVKIAVIGHYNADPEDAFQDLRDANAAADVVIVFPHWGNDYALDPLRQQRWWARTLIDHGADAVIGAHPHVVQPEEIYEGKIIAHSLGNFVFSGMSAPGSRTGAVIELDVTKEGIVAHRYRRIELDERGAPHWNGDATPLPPLDPARDPALGPPGEPMTFISKKRR